MSLSFVPPDMKHGVLAAGYSSYIVSARSDLVFHHVTKMMTFEGLWEVHPASTLILVSIGMGYAAMFCILYDVPGVGSIGVIVFVATTALSLRWIPLK